MTNETTHVFIMARGQGTRLHPLTSDTCKPSVSFGGQYRIIDFVLSNLVQANIQNITVMLPTNSITLSPHLSKYWPDIHTYVIPTDGKPIGNATSILKALQANLDKKATHIGIFPSDQVFHFDLQASLLQHRTSNSKASILTRWHPADRASNFGVLRAENSNIVDFIEKPDPIPESYIYNQQCRVNMGIYWFNRDVLFKTLVKDEQNTISSNDFGLDVLPLLIKDVITHTIDIDASTPWEDVGTIKRYWNTHWQYKSELDCWNIQKTVSGHVLETGYTASPIPNSTKIDQCIIFDSVDIGEHCNLKQMIIDTGCMLESHLNISLDTPIEGIVYRTPECLIIPKNSVVQYNRDKKIITVEQR